MRIILGLCTAALLCACSATSEIQDKGWNDLNQGRAALLSTADVPMGLVASSWAAPYRKEAEDLNPTDIVPLAVMATDPWNVLPPPLGTAYVPWKAFVTVVRAIPFVGYPTCEDSCKVSLGCGEDGGPLWYVIAPAINAVDALVSPIGEDVTDDNTPTPGNGNFFAYWRLRNNAMRKGLEHAGHTMMYLFLNTNSTHPPYDTWYSTQLTRSKTNMHRTFDIHLSNFDWDDPFGY
ncbi:MAG: hypothetical protein EXS14_10735 [Planctomycetes bacterium]|nr:hypothetical protein [Planctomycetota bacterium]